MTDETHNNSRFRNHVWDWRNTAVDKLLGILPRRTAEHLVNAQKEGILAVRSLLDKGIDALDNDLKRVSERPLRDR